MVRRDFTETHADEHLRLIAALIEACAYCEKSENREEVATVLAQPAYSSTPVETLRRSLCGPFHFGGERTEEVHGFHRFAGDDANEPSVGKAQWILEHLLRLGAIYDCTAIRTLASGKVFRSDLYEQARSFVESSNHAEIPTLRLCLLAQPISGPV